MPRINFSYADVYRCRLFKEKHIVFGTHRLRNSCWADWYLIWRIFILLFMQKDACHAYIDELAFCQPFLLPLSNPNNHGLLLNLLRRWHAGMPDVTAMASKSPLAPACRYAGRHSHGFWISSGARMPACRTPQPCLLNLVRRRHAGMPDVTAMASESRPAPACRHAGRHSHGLWSVFHFLLPRLVTLP